MVIDGQAAKAKASRGFTRLPAKRGRPEVPAVHFRPLSIREEGTLHPVRLRRGAEKPPLVSFVLPQFRRENRFTLFLELLELGQSLMPAG